MLLNWSNLGLPSLIQHYMNQLQNKTRLETASSNIWFIQLNLVEETNFNKTLGLPLSLSLPSLQFNSSCTLQSLPNQPSEHWHSQALSTLTLHWPCPEHKLGQPSNVQCFPFQPVTQRQVPFLHWPCSLHRWSHNFTLHNSPVQPKLQVHESPTQWPWGPQSVSHNSANIERI